EVHEGDGICVGSLFGIAACWSEKGQPVPIAAVGVFDVRKVSAENWRVGTPVHWDDAQRKFTCDMSIGKFVGVAVEDSKLESPGVGRLRINGIAA
ncbi:MAG: DUF2190 family protein, partial [Phyllobacteriaceae bacterium]|nr:DUF2190 family protein [Phyllobacteriaceae bacterium]